jgi:hypothetical protein
MPSLVFGIRFFRGAQFCLTDGGQKEGDPMKRNIAVTLVLLMIAVLAIGAACSDRAGKKVAEKMIEGASGGKAKVDLGSGGGVDISALPEILRYPGAKALTRMSVPGGSEGTAGTIYMLQTGDATNAVVDWYKKSLSGWKTVMETAAEKGSIMAFQTADEKQSAVIAIGFDKDKAVTTISVTYSTKTK